MTRKASIPALVLRIAVLFVVALSLLIALAQAQPAPHTHKQIRRSGPTRPEAKNVIAAPDSPTVNFLAPVLYNSGAENPDSIAVADMNGDGKLDIVMADCNAIGAGGCGFKRTGFVGILLGNGDGTFQPVVTYDSGGNLASSVAVADLNGDGNLDVVVTHVCSEADCANKAGVSVLLGNGNGTLLSPVLYSSNGQESYGVAVKDVNRDGKLDLLIALSCAGANCGFTPEGGVSVLLGNGNGTFQAPITYDSGGN